MKCYQWDEGCWILDGIEIETDATIAPTPRFKIPPLKRSEYDISVTTYETALQMPLLNQELAKRVLSATGQADLTVPSIQLLCCDLEKRADFWSMPDGGETPDSVLVLCSFLDGRKRAMCDIVVEGSACEILAKAPISRANGALRGVAALVKLGHGDVVRRTRQVPERIPFNKSPKIISTLRLEPDGFKQYFKGHPAPMPPTWFKMVADSKRQLATSEKEATT